MPLLLIWYYNFLFFDLYLINNLTVFFVIDCFWYYVSLNDYFYFVNWTFNDRLFLHEHSASYLLFVEVSYSNSMMYFISFVQSLFRTVTDELLLHNNLVKILYIQNFNNNLEWLDNVLPVVERVYFPFKMPDYFFFERVWAILTSIFQPAQNCLWWILYVFVYDLHFMFSFSLYDNIYGYIYYKSLLYIELIHMKLNFIWINSIYSNVIGIINQLKGIYSYLINYSLFFNLFYDNTKFGGKIAWSSVFFGENYREVFYFKKFNLKSLMEKFVYSQLAFRQNHFDLMKYMGCLKMMCILDLIILILYAD